jgi:hypothetical protein
MRLVHTTPILGLGRGFVGVLLAVCTFGAGVAWGASQAVQTQKVPPTVLSGADIGFRVEGRKGDAPVGTLVVRVNGQWVEAQFSAGAKLITH